MFFTYLYVRGTMTGVMTYKYLHWVTFSYEGKKAGTTLVRI
jgi:hypothetical protein